MKEADAPKTWDDLLNPRWDGKIGIWVRGEGQGALAATWGDGQGRRLRAQDERAPSGAAAEHVPAGAAGRRRRNSGRIRAQSHRAAADPARRADQGGGGRAGADQHALQLRPGARRRTRAAARCSRSGSRRPKAPRSTRTRPTAAIRSSPAPRPTPCCAGTRCRNSRSSRPRTRPAIVQRINKMIESRETQ